MKVLLSSANKLPQSSLLIKIDPIYKYSNPRGLGSLVGKVIVSRAGGLDSIPGSTETQKEGAAFALISADG